MNARDVLGHLLPFPARFSEALRNKWADDIIEQLAEYGFLIMKKEDVEAIRDKELEEAAKVSEDYARRAMAATPSAQEAAAAASGVADAIRSLKSEARG